MSGQVWVSGADDNGEWVPLAGVVAVGFDMAPVATPPVTVPIRTSFTTSFKILAPVTRQEKRQRRALDRVLWGWYRPDPKRQLIHNGRKPRV